MVRLVLILLAVSGHLFSEARYVPEKKMYPLFGCFVTDLYDFEYQSNKFSVGGYMWTRHKEINYLPESSIEVVNSEDFEHKGPYIYAKNDLVYFGEKFNATVFHHWDMTHFPFDKQVLKINFEDAWYDLNELEFIPDTKNSGKSPDITISGWKIIDFQIFAKVYNYQSNFGELGRNESGFSRVTAAITIKRNWVRPFINYFTIYFLSFLLSILALLIHPSELSTKFSLTLASVFAVVSNNLLVDQVVPITSSFSLTDKVEAATFLFVMLAVVFNSYEIPLYLKKGVGVRKKVLWWVAPPMILGYIIYVGYGIYQACCA